MTLTAPTAVAGATGHAPSRAAARIHIGIGAAQIAAGVGNLAFVLLIARILDARDFALVAAFVAGHTLLHLPGVALGAGTAVDPRRALRILQRSLLVTLPLGALVILRATAIAGLIGMPSGMVAALAVALPGAPALGALRGAAYGKRAHAALERSLLVEPAVRLGLGVVLAAVAGPVAAAVAVVAASYAAIGLLLRDGLLARCDSLMIVPAVAARATTTARWATLSFLAFAVLQQQDLLIANRLLRAEDFAVFAVVSTIGGAIAFATATLPLVVLPSGEHGDARARVAFVGAAGLGAIAVVIAALERHTLVRALVGHSDARAAALLPAYITAMGILGIARVVAATRLRSNRPRLTGITVCAVALGHAVALVGFVRTSTGVVVATTLAMVALAASLAAPNVLRLRPVAGRLSLLRQPRARRISVALGGALLVGVALRIASMRGLWVDEAISITQARLPLGTMLATLRATDVHPPLHLLILWATVRTVGTGELAVRLPSIIAGALTIPALYGLARELYDRRTGMVAAVLAVPAPFLVWYSQESRMYALFMLLAVLSAWAQIVAIRRGERLAWLAWSLSTAALVATQWFAVVPLAVELAAFVIVGWRRRAQRAELLAFLRRCGAATAVLVLLVAPLVPFLLGQLAAYRSRGGAALSALPSAAGGDVAAATTNLSVYAVGANLIWAATGYHADGTMAQIAALWPFTLLAGLALLGRHWRAETKLMVALVVAPLAVLFALGTFKRDLFELRYASGAVPMVTVLMSRAISGVARTKRTLVAATAAVTLVLGVSLADQQLNGANPRLYDFQGALSPIESERDPAAVLAYQPDYLADVLAYYAPDVRSMPLERLDPKRAGPIYVLVPQRLVDDPASSAAIGTRLADIERTHTLVGRIQRPNVEVWKFR